MGLHEDVKERSQLLAEIDGTRYYVTTRIPDGRKAVKWKKIDDRRNRDYKAELSVVVQMYLEGWEHGKFSYSKWLDIRAMNITIREALPVLRADQDLVVYASPPYRYGGREAVTGVEVRISLPADKPSQVVGEEDLLERLGGLDLIQEEIIKAINAELLKIQEAFEHNIRVGDAKLIAQWFEKNWMERATMRSRYEAKLAAINAELKVEFAAARKKLQKKMVKRLKKDKKRKWDQRSIDAALRIVEYPGPPSIFRGSAADRLKAEDVE